MPTPKRHKCEILNLELGNVLQRNRYKAAGLKLWGKTRIVVNFNTERLQLNHSLVPCYGSKKMTKERIDLFEVEDRKFTNLEKDSDKL